MIKATQKEIKEFAARYTDITHIGMEDYKIIQERESGLFEGIAYSCGRYGCNGKIIRGGITGEIYVIAARSTALFLFD